MVIAFISRVLCIYRSRHFDTRSYVRQCNIETMGMCIRIVIHLYRTGARYSDNQGLPPPFLSPTLLAWFRSSTTRKDSLMDCVFFISFGRG